MEIKHATHTLRVDDANLAASTFHNVNLSQAEFSDVNLSQASFDDINLNAARFTNCRLTGVTVNGSPLEDALNALESVLPPPAPHPTAGLHIRSFHESDTAAVILLWQSVFEYTAPHNNPEVSIRQKLKVDRNLFAVASQDSQLAGTILAGYDGHRGWIYSLAVDSRFRRRGIATAMVRWAEQALLRRGCMKVNLQLMASNAGTTAFYMKLGYNVEQRISMGKLL